MLVDENVRLGAILLAILTKYPGRSVGCYIAFLVGRSMTVVGCLVERTANAGRDFERDSMNRAQMARGQHLVEATGTGGQQSSTLQSIPGSLPTLFVVV
jgi:hypothetical protein